MIFHLSVAYLVQCNGAKPMGMLGLKHLGKNMTGEKWNQFLQLGFRISFRL